MNHDKSHKAMNYDAMTTHFNNDVGARTKNDKEGKTMRIEKIPLDKLAANRFQTRLGYDKIGKKNETGKEEEIPDEIKEDEEFKSLKQSISKHGLQQPIGVHELPTSDGGIGYEIIFGHRRVLAFKLLFEEQKKLNVPDSENKYKTIQAIIHPNEELGTESSDGFKNVDKLLVLNIIENLHRKDLSLIEKAFIYERLQDQIDEKKVNEEYENKKKEAKKKNISKIPGKKSIALKFVADFLNIDYINVLKTVRAKNSLHGSIIKEILEARNDEKKKIRIDNTILIELGTLKGSQEQLKLWDDFQKNKTSREDMRERIREAREELGLIKTNLGLMKTNGKDNKNQISKSKEYDGIRIHRDKQGLKIRNERIVQLEEKEKFLLEREISKTIDKFLKEKKAGKLSKKLKGIEEESNSDNTLDDE